MGSTIKVRDMIKLVEADGWVFDSMVGDHRQFEHPTKTGKVTIPGGPNDDIARELLSSIIKQAQLKGNIYEILQRARNRRKK